MLKKSRRYKSDFAKMDAVPGKPDAESPEIKRKDIGLALVKVTDPFGPLLNRKRAPRRAKKRPLYMLVDQDVLEFFRGSGPGWQSRINALLRKALSHEPAPRTRALAKASRISAKKAKRSA